VNGLSSDPTSLSIKQCRACGLPKPISEFSKASHHADGLNSYCKKCDLEVRKQNKAQARAANPKLEWAKMVIGSARCRARARSLPFDLTPDYVASLAPDVCPALGIPLRYPTPEDVYTPQAMYRDSPSLDRIIPALGYVRGNVIVVSMRTNSIKNDATMPELRQVADFYARLIDTRLYGDNN